MRFFRKVWTIVLALTALAAQPALGQSVADLPTEVMTVVSGGSWQVFISDLAPLTPPPVFEDYYNDVVACTETAQPPVYEELDWFTASYLMELDDGEVYELWAVYFSPPAEIILTVQDEETVKHELYHFITDDMSDELADACLEEV